MLDIKNGIVQNKNIYGVPFYTMIVADTGRGNVRSGIAMEHIIGITNHNTGNVGATAINHAKWLANVAAADELDVSVHFFVDDTCIVQTVPLNEVTWHAGDGRGDGNMHTISVEICEVSNQAGADANAIALNAALLVGHGNWRIFKHQDWTGKYCPRLILARNGWDAFVKAIWQKHAAATRMAARDNNPSPWALSAVQWGLKHHIISVSTDGDLELHRPATREEVLAMIQRAWEKQI